MVRIRVVGGGKDAHFDGRFAGMVDGRPCEVTGLTGKEASVRAAAGTLQSVECRLEFGIEGKKVSFDCRVASRKVEKGEEVLQLTFVPGQGTAIAMMLVSLLNSSRAYPRSSFCNVTPASVS
jgi:hypothetical protein